MVLFESPVPILAVGGLLIAALVAGWLKVGDFRLAVAAAGVLLVTIAMLVCERLVVTDGELIQEVIYSVAAEVKAGNAQGAVAHINPEAPETRQRALNELSLFKVTEVAIKRPVQIELKPAKNPTRATARFNVNVTGGDASGLISDRNVPRYLEVQFTKEGGRWWVESYQHFDPLHGMRHQPEY